MTPENSNPLIIYVHGFNSSPASWKAQALDRYRQHYSPNAAAQQLSQQLKGGVAAAEIPMPAQYRVEVPELSHWPEEAMATLQMLVEQQSDEVLLVGSSLGGYYSVALTERYDHCRAVLVNPAVRPYELLARWLGENENIYTHDKYLLTREHLAQLQALNVEQLADPERYLLMLQTGDETLDYRETLAKYPQLPCFLQEGGSHGFEQFDEMIPMILAYACGARLIPQAPVLPLVRHD